MGEWESALEWGNDSLALSIAVSGVFEVCGRTWIPHQNLVLLDGSSIVWRGSERYHNGKWTSWSCESRHHAGHIRGSYWLRIRHSTLTIDVNSRYLKSVPTPFGETCDCVGWQGSISDLGNQKEGCPCRVSAIPEKFITSNWRVSSRCSRCSDQAPINFDLRIGSRRSSSWCAHLSWDLSDPCTWGVGYRGSSVS